VSRSGTTVSALLLRGHDGADSLRLSFVLSVPAAFGAGLLVVLDDGLPTIDPGAATLALALAAVVGYLTVDALVRVVDRVAFWKVCVSFGALAMAGGGLLLR
jgi:undecaprenyl-diphosphatase